MRVYVLAYVVAKIGKVRDVSIAKRLDILLGSVQKTKTKKVGKEK